MSENQIREGEPIYAEGKIEIRTFPNGPDEHSVWIGEDYFVLQIGCLAHFALSTPPSRLERALDNYDPMIPYSLKKAKISPTEFALILARAKAKELQDEVNSAYSEIRNLEEMAKNE